MSDAASNVGSSEPRGNETGDPVVASSGFKDGLILRLTVSRKTLRDENERLRTALEEIRDLPAGFTFQARDVAEGALRDAK